MSGSLTADEIEAVVRREVEDVEVIDVHTHLLPPTHGDQLLFGIDELLTYHYLVAETFAVLPLESPLDGTSDEWTPPTPDEFFAWSKPRQAELVFHTLFVERTPLSEACRGVLTVLARLGLSDMLAAARRQRRGSRLDELRRWFSAQDPAEYLERVFTLAKVRYAVMTNIPFAPDEATHWLATPQPALSPRLKTALRVDPLLAGDWPAVLAALRRDADARGGRPYPPTLAGCRQYLRDWCERIQPVYLMASTPAGFTYTPSQRAKRKRRVVRNADDGESGGGEGADGEGVGGESVGGEGSDVEGGKGAAESAEGSVGGATAPSGAELLEEVLLAVASERQLPLALKVGAVRGVNPRLRAGGDGVETADLRFVASLCARYPHVKVLLTVLSEANQHEACVLARKFGNLHVYGCWWFCNNPSIIRRVSAMRLEILGTAFTAQHSDARVLDQLLYKWAHSRHAVADALVPQYAAVLRAGWQVSVDDVRADVRMLFGGAYEHFMLK